MAGGNSVRTFAVACALTPFYGFRDGGEFVEPAQPYGLGGRVRDAAIGDESDDAEFHVAIPIFVVATGAGQTRTQAHICGTNSI